MCLGFCKPIGINPARHEIAEERIDPKIRACMDTGTMTDETADGTMSDGTADGGNI